MIPFYALVVSFLLFKALGLLGMNHFEGWQTPLQGAVAVMLLLAASAHWGKRRPDLIRMVPPAFPRPDLIVSVTGLLEIAGAVAILLPATSQAASIGLTVLLVAMFPANVRAAKENMTIGGRPVPKLFIRSVLQLIFIAAILLAGFCP
ncbi:DoxX family protein [Paenibacillus thailandensis]|uniref:DoxX family protein n=1 Tax=Paenibacillus thailandensis TaxID=393250 RepID=A0ABW5QVN9_9BACL